MYSGPAWLNQTRPRGAPPEGPWDALGPQSTHHVARCAPSLPVLERGALRDSSGAPRERIQLIRILGIESTCQLNLRPEPYSVALPYR